MFIVHYLLFFVARVTVTDWSHPDTLLLIEKYRQHTSQFSKPGIKKTEAWKSVAADMNAVKGDGSFTAETCQKKWNNLAQTFKEKHDKKGKTGRGGGKGWTYYQEMEEILGDRAAVQSVSTMASKSLTGQFKVPPSRSVSVTSVASSRSGSFSVGTNVNLNPTAPSLVRPSLLPTSQRPSASVSCPRVIIPRAVTPSSVISPPSESSDEEELDAAARISVAETPRGTGLKRKRAGRCGTGNQDFQDWAEKFSKEQRDRDERLAARLDSLEDLERKRLGVLIEMKDLMKTWVDLAKDRQNSANK